MKKRTEEEGISVGFQITVWSALFLVVAAVVAASFLWPDFGRLVIFLSSFCISFFGIVILFSVVVVFFARRSEKNSNKQEAEKNRPDP